MTKQAFVDSQTKAAAHFRVKRQTFCGWSMEPDFPKKTARGWSLQKIDEWLRTKQLGPHRNVKSTNGTLSEARLKYLQERTRTERATATQAEIDLATSTGEILLAADVAELHQRIASTSMTILDQLSDAVDRELPENCPSTEAWPAIRARVVVAAERIRLDVVTQIREFIAGSAAPEEAESLSD